MKMTASKTPEVTTRPASSDDSGSGHSETSSLLGGNQRSSSDEIPKELSTRQKLTITSIVMVGVFLSTFDATVVAAILSSIASELNALASIQWVATGYMVACAAFQPLFGKLSDIFGRKALLMTCNILFAVGCAICGVSENLVTLVAGRVVAGMGGGGLMTIGTVVMSDFIPLRERGVYQGIGNIVFGTGAALGGILGGYFAEIFGWRAVFLYQVPLIIASVFTIMIFLPETSHTFLERKSHHYGTSDGDGQPEERRYSIFYNLGRVDFFGSVTLVTSISALMIACDLLGKRFSWSDPVVSGLGLVTLLTAILYVYIEKYIAKEPVTPMNLFNHGTVVFSSISVMFSCMTTFALIYYAPIFLASVQGMGPYKVGISLTGTFVSTSAGSFFTGLYIKKTGKYRTFTAFSLLVSLIGNIALLFFDESTSEWFIILTLALHRWGQAALATVTLLVLLASVPPDRQAVVTSIQYTFRAIGSTVGVSLAAMLFNNILYSQLNNRLPSGSEDIISKLLDSVEEVNNLPAELRAPVITSFRQASVAVFALALAESVLAVVTALFIKERKLHATLHRTELEEQDD
jgi:MFS family permease